MVACSTAHKCVAIDEKSIRQLFALAYSDSRTGSDFEADGVGFGFKPNGITFREVYSVVLNIDPKGLAEFPRTVRQFGDFVSRAKLLHRLDSVNGLQGSNQDGGSLAYVLAHNVHAITIVNGVDIQSPGWTKHRAISFGLADGSMAGRIIMRKVSFGFNDDCSEFLGAQNAY